MLWIMGEGDPVLGLQHSGGVCVAQALRCVCWRRSFIRRITDEGRRFLGKNDGNAYL